MSDVLDVVADHFAVALRVTLTNTPTPLSTSGHTFVCCFFLSLAIPFEGIEERKTSNTVNPIIIQIIQEITPTLHNFWVSTRHHKQNRTSPSYCSINLTGLGDRGRKVRDSSARVMNLVKVINLFFVTATQNNPPPTFRHCK